MAIVLVVMGYAVAGQYGMNLPGWAPPVNILVPWVIVYITYYLGGLKNKAVLFLGGLSYEFYIVHGFIVMQLGNVRITNMVGVNTCLLIICVLLLTIVSALILSKLCSRINQVIK